jgi:hypothetical protein
LLKINQELILCCDLIKKHGFPLFALSYGCPPHGGIALGNKMKNKKDHTVGTVLKCNLRNRGKIDRTNTHIHDCSQRCSHVYVYKFYLFFLCEQSCICVLVLSILSLWAVMYMCIRWKKDRTNTHIHWLLTEEK